MQALELQQLELLFYLLLGLVFLILVILVAYVVIANRRQRAELVQAYEADKLAPRPTLRLTGHVLSLVRDEKGDPIKVEVAGVKYRNLAEIKDPVVRRHVVDAALELIRFTGVIGQNIAVPAHPNETQTWREDIRARSRGELDEIRAGSPVQGGGVQVSSEDRDVEQQFLGLLESMGQTRAAPERPTIVSSIQQSMTAKSSEQDNALSIVNDIEDIVQRRIRLIPSMVNRDLHVQLKEGGSVRFTFDGKEYENLEDVPNLTARQLIKDAIREWEET